MQTSPETYEFTFNGLRFIFKTKGEAIQEIDILLNTPPPPPPPPPIPQIDLSKYTSNTFQALEKGFKTGQTIYLENELTAETGINFTIPGVSYIGGTFRTKLSTMPNELITARVPISFNQTTFSGLGDDYRDQVAPYDLVKAVGSGLIFDKCVFEHHQQYLLELHNANQPIVKDCLVRYGQNGISFNGKCQGGVVEGNTIYDCSQAPIKIRGCTATTVRDNKIELAYNYWKAFDHLRFPGTDGKGIEGHNSQGSQGIYFGVTDPMPCFSCEVYNNEINDYSNHKLRSEGVWFPMDAGSVKSENNRFHNNTINGSYYGIHIAEYLTRFPQPLYAYDNQINNVVKNEYREENQV